jgi:chemotaxis protein methyltransferase CheR
MKPEDFDLFATLVRQRSGLVLSRDKAYLLESRLMPVARRYNLATLEDMARAMRQTRDEAMSYAITEAMTTNETFFFRDQKPFTLFEKTILPALLNSRSSRKTIRIWSAAASSGQEAYSLAMICTENGTKLQGWRVEIVGTDISREMVERAKTGIYSQFEVQRGMPVTMLVKYFQQLSGDKWQIKENIRQMVQFREGNLLTEFTGLGVFDIILCRNVLIYFDAPTKGQVLDRMAGVIAQDGFLMMGGAETVLGITEKFKPGGAEHGLYILSSAQPLAKSAVG